MPVGQSNQQKTRAMVARSNEDGEEACMCVSVQKPRSRGNSERVNRTDQLVLMRQYTVQLAVFQSNDGHIYIEVGKLNGWTVKELQDSGCTRMIVDRASIPDSMVIYQAVSSGLLQIDVPLANVYLYSPKYKVRCNVMCVSSSVYAVINGKNSELRTQNSFI